MRPQIYEATAELGDKNTFRNQQEVSQEISQENSGHPDHTFKVIKTLNLMEYTKKLTQVTDAGCQDIAEIVKVKDTIEADLPKNTKSSKKYKIAIDESAAVEKTKTTINNILRYYHDEVTHPDDVHEDRVAQLP